MMFIRMHVIRVAAVALGFMALTAIPPVVAQSQDRPAAAADPLFAQPYVDTDEWRAAPVRHRYVHGGFKGTQALFSFYFPPKEQYQGRFFQHITPIPISENLAQQDKGEDNKMGFAIASGGYFVETNEGGMGAMGMPGSTVDPSIAGYRVNAAAAEYSRVIAARMYGPHRPYGYAFGGSGGAYRTIGGFENTRVWDGVVPYVVGSPMAIPNVFTVRVRVLRMLKDKLPAIADAVDAGGSGDMYAGLSPEEREALTEATRLGFPPRAWFAYARLGMGALPVLLPGLVKDDPTYFDDFWKIPGYLGANPPASLRRARVQHKTTVAQTIMEEDAKKLGLPLPVIMMGRNPVRGGVDNAWKTLQGTTGPAPVALRLSSLPKADNYDGWTLIVQSGASANEVLPILTVRGDVVVLGFGVNPKIAAGIKTGDALELDNSRMLAIETYHRHQVPTPDFYVWDQFRGPDGKPLYPQRPKLIGPEFATSAAGSIQSGRFGGKMIVVESLMDADAFPWQADWYRSKVKAALEDKLDDHFRVWFTDHAEHGDLADMADSTHIVSYLGVVYQALRDLSAWVEKDVAPPTSTHYKVVDGQIEVPASAAERRGIQPVVTLNANGSVRADVGVGEPVELSAMAEVPPGAGKIVTAEWDFDGSGQFAVKEHLHEAAARIKLTRSYTFTRPGVYFPVLRVTSQRNVDSDTVYARIHNLGRVRVVVK